MSNAKRRQLSKDGTGRGAVSKTAVVGVKDRETLHGFVHEQTNPDAQVYMDDASNYMSIDRAHESFNHSVSEYVREQARTNGMGSFWAALKRGYHSTFHHFPKKHMHRYFSEFAERPNDKGEDTYEIMANVVEGIKGKQLRYRELVA